MKLKTLAIISVMLFSLGCSHAPAKPDEFMKNTPKQMHFGQLPYSKENGIIYEV
jgi:hypothetical protein